MASTATHSPQQPLCDVTEFVAGRYKRYKRGTNKLLHWLVDTASQCGDLNTIIGRHGAKAREHDLILSTQDIIKLARSIASCKPAVTVPLTISFALDDVIASRKECAS